MVDTGHSLQSSITALVSVGQYDLALKTLLESRMIDTAHRLLLLLQTSGVNLDPGVEERVVTETVKMMADIEYKEAFEMYCENLGQDAASKLKTELNISTTAA